MKALYSLGMACVLLVTGLQAVESEMNLTNDVFAQSRRHRCHDRCHHHRRSDSSDEPCFDPCKKNHCTSYISVYSPTTSPQTIDSTGIATPINFTNILSGPLGITPIPALGPYNTFEIQCSGIYLIGWTLTGTTDEGTTGTVSVTIRDITTGLDIPPSPFASFSQVGAGTVTSASGQTIATFLEKGHLIQLLVSVTVGGTGETITDPTLFITQVACLPQLLDEVEVNGDDNGNGWNGSGDRGWRRKRHQGCLCD